MRDFLPRISVSCDKMGILRNPAVAGGSLRGAKCRGWVWDILDTHWAVEMLSRCK